MPIKLSDQYDIPRIKAQNENGEFVSIRRAYQGTTLVYGLYDVHYYDRDYIDEYSPKLYAWGYAPEAVEFPLPNDAPDYFDTYLTHYGDSTGNHGWYEDCELNTQKDKIDIDDHRDLDVYARWRQKRFAYEGVVAYDVYTYVPPTPGGMPTPDNDNYPWSGSASLSMPNCTWYVYYRVQEMGYPSPFNDGYGDAGWWWLNNATNGWSNIGWTNNWKPGDILVWNGHVAIVESDGEVSESVYTERLLNGTYLPRSGTAKELYDWVVSHWDDTAESYFTPGASGGSLGSRYWSKQSGGSRWFDGAGIGILRHN